MSPPRSTTRRSFLRTALSVLGSLAATAPFLAGCGVPAEEALAGRFVAALRSALAGAVPAGAFASVGMGRDEALENLRGDLSPRRFQALAWNDALLRRYLAGRRRRDLESGRTRTVDGWIVAESELAIAALLGPEVGRR
jgi:hypothetical protein